MRRRRWIALGLLAVAVVLGVWMWQRGDAPRSVRSHRTARVRRLDVGEFRAQLAARVQRARRLAVHPPAPPPKPSSSRSKAVWKDRGAGAIPNFGKRLIEPECTLGPRELCATLSPLIAGCDAGDASDCIAVGQFLADTPPRAPFATVFFGQACRIGDPAGCERVDELSSDVAIPCENDPLACGMRAMRLKDRALHDHACSLGVAASCSFMSEFTKDDPDTSRGYLETGCQLGEPVMCMDLGHRLQPGCEDNELRPCYEPDPQQARAALEIACAAGWDSKSVCDQIAPP